MTSSPVQSTTTQGNDGGEQLLALLQRGYDNVHRVSQHACLLERRLRGGGKLADLLLLVQDIKFAVEELQTLLHSAEQTVVSVRTRTGRTAR